MPQEMGWNKAYPPSVPLNRHAMATKVSTWNY
ncbi:MAG: hypothetical protein QOE54_5034 [Streptosporangiaceae bacterium]|nr:hypothetical protein [Streptosporangiaceae bacterium]MDX6432668.1 hypothetical protein [Streptosporangiaceae bacterium]